MISLSELSARSVAAIEPAAEALTAAEREVLRRERFVGADPEWDAALGRFYALWQERARS